MNIESQREDLSRISLMNGRVTVMPPKLGQSEVSDSLTGVQRLIRTVKPPQGQSQLAGTTHSEV